MTVRALACAPAAALILWCGSPARAQVSDQPTTTPPLSVKVGTFALGDDTAGGSYGASSKFSAGLEYQFGGLRTDSRLRTSAYFDYAYGSGTGGALEMYSTGIAERLAVGRVSRGGAFPYLGVGLGANLNVASAPDHANITHEAEFAQKVFAGLQRGDGIFYELYFRAAPQNAGIITSGVGFSFGYHL